MAENTVTNNEENKLMNEKLRINLRKMIKSFDNYIKDASDYDQLEDNLKHMEETDENFHKYDLVEMLTDRIEATLGSSIDKHVNDAFNTLKFDGDIDLQNKLAQSICVNIMRTKEFSDFKTQFKANVFKANDSLMKNFQSNFIETNSEEITIHENETKSITFTNDFEYSSSLDNSLNQNSFVFFNSEQFPLIAQNLDPRKPEQNRLRAIQQLLSIPAGDPQAADHWVDIRRYLLSAFKDPNEKIAELCLKLHSRTLASSHYKVSLEIYITLLEHLNEYFKDRELEKRQFKASVDFLGNENAYLLKIFRLINDYAKDVTNKWTRYPESFIETIINETLKTFSIVSADLKSTSYMTPVHYIALLDTQANWFVKWMHGHDSRKILINSIRKNESFLQNSIYSIHQYLNTNLKRLTDTSAAASSSSLNSASMYSNVSSATASTVQSAAGSRKKSTTVNCSTTTTLNSLGLTKRSTFKRSEIEYAHFVHSINVVRKILCFKNGRRLLPLKVQNKEVTLKDLIKTIIQIIYETASFKTTNEYSPSKYAFDLLQDLCSAEDTCEVCLCNEDVIDYLIKPLKAILQIKKNQNQSLASISSASSSTATNCFIYEESCMLILANVLSKLASTQCGYFQLLYNDSKQNFSPILNKNSAANIIITFVCKALSNQLNYNVSTSEIAEYLHLARLLYSQCQGAFLIKEYELNKAISDVLKVIINKNSNSNSAPSTPRLNSSNITYKEMFTFSWSDSLLDNLVSMASTPKGVFFLNETGLLSRVVNYMFSRYKSKLQVGKHEKFGYGFIISQLANTPSGCFYLNESLLIQYLIDEIWTELEYGSDDFMSAFPRSYSVEPIDREVYKPMLCLLNILSSFSGVYELLGDAIATPRTYYDIRDAPKGLIGLMDRVTFLDNKVKIRSLCNYEQSHMFGLRLLSYLQTDLDVLLLLESQYSYTSLLLNLQRANRPIKAKYDFNDQTGNVNKEEDELNDDLMQSETTEKLSIMIDMLSVERNFVLVNSNIIGGPSEKLVPSRDFILEQQPYNDKSVTSEKNKTYAYPLFDELPVSDFYLKQCDYTLLINDTNFSEFIRTKFEFEQIVKNDDSQTKWLNKYRKLFYNMLKANKFNLDNMPQALAQIVQVYLRGPEFNSLISVSDYKNFNEFNTKSANQILASQLNSLQKLGIEKTVEYGLHIGQLKSTKEDASLNLVETYKTSKVMLKNANRNRKVPPSPNSAMKRSYLNCCQEDSFPSYDWFVSTIYILFRGDKQASLSFLYNFHFLKMSSLLWPARLYSNDSLISPIYTLHGISILISTTCHYIELILKIELPLVFSAFRMSGLAPSQICSHWLKQLFWNYLDWPNIVTFLSICIIYGIDYQAYFCVAILKHLNRNQKIVQHHTYKDLQIYLKENQIEDFTVDKYIDFMFELENKYRYLIMEDIRNTI